MTGEAAMPDNSKTSRRELLGALGTGVAAAALATPVAAEDVPLKVVDFHNHYAGPSWTLTTLAGLPPGARPTWERINAKLQSPYRSHRLDRSGRDLGAGDQH